jgi:hypothetical protein
MSSITLHHEQASCTLALHLLPAYISSRVYYNNGIHRFKSKTVKYALYHLLYLIGRKPLQRETRIHVTVSPQVASAAALLLSVVNRDRDALH